MEYLCRIIGTNNRYDKASVSEGVAVMIFFFIPDILIIIIYFVLMGFGIFTTGLLAEYIIKWQYPILAIMLIAALAVNIYMAREANSNIILRFIYGISSTFLDFIKQIISLVLLMVFLEEIINNLHKQGLFMLVFGFVYIFLLIFLFFATLFGCYAINGLTSWLLEKTNGNAALIISVIINVIWTIIYSAICIYLISADSSEFTYLFGKSEINTFMMQMEKIFSPFVIKY